MNYEVRLTPAARRHLGRLPEAERAAVLETLRALSEGPHRLGKPLRLQLEGLYVARRGEYRIVYAIEDESQHVSVLRVAHRRDAYRT